jgi:glycosidase
MCDFFSLRDFWTAPDSVHFDQLVDEFVGIYSFYLTVVGVDGLRVDTVKHVHHEFWDAFTERLRRRLGSAARGKLIFGEVYDGDPAVLGRYTWRSDWKQNPAPCLDSVLDFQFCFSAREYLRHPGASFGSPRQLETALKNRRAVGPEGRAFYNRNPGPDGRNGADKAITFIENHDGLNRFRVNGVTERRNLLAQALVLTGPGIPCLYYGTEFSVCDADGRIGQDGESGRATLFRSDHDHTWSRVLGSTAFRDIGRLTALRRELPALRDGSFTPLWVDSGERNDDNGVFAYARGREPGSPAIVVINASDGDAATGDLQIDGEWKPALVIGPEATRVITNNGRRLPKTPGCWARGLRQVVSLRVEECRPCTSFRQGCDRAGAGTPSAFVAVGFLAVACAVEADGFLVLGHPQTDGELGDCQGDD